MKPKALKILKAGLLACLLPLIFDIALSMYAGSIRGYAPPYLYPAFFIIGAVLSIDGLRKERSSGEKNDK